MPPDGTVVIEYSFELFELQKIAQAGRKNWLSECEGGKDEKRLSRKFWARGRKVGSQTLTRRNFLATQIGCGKYAVRSSSPPYCSQHSKTPWPTFGTNQCYHLQYGGLEELHCRYLNSWWFTLGAEELRTCQGSCSKACAKCLTRINRVLDQKTPREN